MGEYAELMSNLVNLRPLLVAALAAVSIGAAAAQRRYGRRNRRRAVAPDPGPDAGLHRPIGHCGGSGPRHGSRGGPG